MKKTRLSFHAAQPLLQGGATEEEVRSAIVGGEGEPAKHGRLVYRLSFEYNALWQEWHSATKRVAPVVTWRWKE